MSQHTYLRYECADAFGVVVAASSSSSICATSNGVVWSTAESHVVVFHRRLGRPIAKLAHRKESNMGSGRALNDQQVTCLDIGSGVVANQWKIATGWNDGAVRVFDWTEEAAASRGKDGLVNSLLGEDSCVWTDESLVLNGHSQSPVRVVSLDASGTRLASGGSDGAVVLWDILAETGLFRLLGHEGPISALRFLSPHQMLSTSLDGRLKVWDLEWQSCIQTVANHRGEVLCCAVANLDDSLAKDGASDDSKVQDRWRVVTGCADGQIRMFQKAHDGLPNGHQDRKTAKHSAAPLSFMGTIRPNTTTAVASNEKVTCVQFHSQYVGILRANSKTIDLYRIRNLAETQAKRNRRLRRKREKEKKSFTKKRVEEGSRKRGILDQEEEEEEGEDGEEEDGDAKRKADGDQAEELETEEDVKASDELEYVTTIRASHKIKSFTFAPKRAVTVICALATNALEFHPWKEGETVRKDVVTMDLHGHPTGIRAIALSTDDVMACTVSKSVAKLWNVANRSCLRSLPLTGENDGSTYYGLCATFLPGNTHIVVGTREGHLLLLDVASGDVVYLEEKAHNGAIWSVALRPSRPDLEEAIAFVTGSADTAVKFWDVERQESSRLHPMVVHTRTLQMSDDVVAARYSHVPDPAKRLVFVSTLDCTVKVFFDDSLKFFLSLYGHSLPALAVDASDDNVLLASGGADKSLKIWGLDFGDTHRTLYGHADSITDLQFVRKTHNLFSASKDGTVRYWDGDRLVPILLLTGHSAEIQSLAVSRTGAYVLTGGMDRQIRVWERTRDMVFLEEEREMELEAMFDKANTGDEKDTATILQRRRRRGDGMGELQDGNDDDDEDPQEQQPESEAAVKKSVLSVASGDRLMEGIELADLEMKEMAAFAKAAGTARKPPNPLLLGLEPPLYLEWVLRSIKDVELEQSLLVLPLQHVQRLLFYLIELLRSGRSVELCSRVAVFLIKTHHHQIVANPSLGVPLRELKGLIKRRLGEIRDLVGFNLAALRSVARVSQNRFASHSVDQPVDVWAGLGLGSDIAAAVERPKHRKGRKGRPRAPK